MYVLACEQHLPPVNEVPEEGASRWPAGHTLDVASLFRLAPDKAPAGSQLCAAAEEGITVREIAQVLGRHLNVPGREHPAPPHDPPDRP